VWFGPAYPETREVIVHTKDGKSIRGVLTERSRDYVTLGKAQLVTGQSASAEMGGQVLVFRSEISFIQVLGFRD
jgi:hypothetical protein